MVAQYREVCGFAPSKMLPITFFQVQAVSLHLWLMNQPRFPFPLLGLVHLRNSNEQPKPVPQDVRYELRATLGPARRIPQGLIFDIITEAVGDNGDVLSRSVTTPLVRMKLEGGGGKMPEPKLPEMKELERFCVPADIGRRYAAVAKDYNPIHLHPLSARLFGFKRAIAHGMWSVARCAAALEPLLPGPATSLSVQYRAPLLLPAEVSLKRALGEAPLDFALMRHDGQKMYLNGRIG
jgi:hypothetical protein